MHPFQNLPLYDVPDSQILSSSGSVDDQYWIVVQSGEKNETQLNDFLSKILAAIDINLSTSVHLLALDISSRIYIHKLLSAANGGKIILCFGISPRDLGLAVTEQLYEIIHLNGHDFLFCDNLGAIYSDANKKRALWEVIQSIRPK